MDSSFRLIMRLKKDAPAGRREKEPAVEAIVAAAFRPQVGSGTKRQIDSEERPVEGKGSNSIDGPFDQDAEEIGTNQSEPEEQTIEGEGTNLSLIHI